MNKARVLIFGVVVTVALVVGGIAGATASRSPLVPVFAALNATSPSPTPAFKSNETPSHEAGESASREAAENNGTFQPGGPGGPGGAGMRPCGGHSNETAAHEKGESAAREAAENAPCPAAAASPTPTK